MSHQLGKQLGVISVALIVTILLTGCTLNLNAPVGDSKRDIKRYQHSAYVEAKTNCSLFTWEELSHQYGGDPRWPRTIAKAYSRDEEKLARKHARRGCYQGLIDSKV